MNGKSLFLILLTGVGLHASAAPVFFMPERIFAVEGVPCNFHFAQYFDSVRPDCHAFEARCDVGRSIADRWTWTPERKDSGKRHRLVVNAWSDDGLVASATTTVVVAGSPDAKAKARRVTLALLAASDTNCRYQDQLLKRMREAGFDGYRPVGSHSGDSASLVCEPEKQAPHDGYGGFTWDAFLTRYAVSVDEIDNVQAEAEREQLKAFGVKVPKGEEWRKALLKSPIVRLRNGRKVVDVQSWFDRVNGGEAPDVIVISLGGNVVWALRPETTDEGLAGELAAARKLLAALRKAAPRAVIAVTTSMAGSLDQDSWAHNYGCRQTCFLAHRAFLRYDREMKGLVEASGDKRLRFVPLAHNVHPLRGYPCGEYGNALHANASGGGQMGDALYAWLRNELESWR